MPERDAPNLDLVLAAARAFKDSLRTFNAKAFAVELTHQRTANCCTAANALDDVLGVIADLLGLVGDELGYLMDEAVNDLTSAGTAIQNIVDDIAPELSLPAGRRPCDEVREERRALAAR